MILPPYWFSLDTPDSIPLKDRIEKLVEMREKINNEIFCLKSIIAKQHANPI
jgi:hypothetical protein